MEGMEGSFQELNCIPQDTRGATKHLLVIFKPVLNTIHNFVPNIIQMCALYLYNYSISLIIATLRTWSPALRKLMLTTLENIQIIIYVKKNTK